MSPEVVEMDRAAVEGRLADPSAIQEEKGQEQRKRPSPPSFVHTLAAAAIQRRPRCGEYQVRPSCILMPYTSRLAHG